MSDGRRLGFVRATTVETPGDEGPRTEGWTVALAGDRSAHAFQDTAGLLEFLAGVTTPLRLFSCSDREVITLLCDGIRDVKFRSVAKGTILCATSQAGHLEWCNAGALFGGLGVSELLEVAQGTPEKKPTRSHKATSRRDELRVAHACLSALLTLGARFHALVGVDPLCGQRRTAAGLAFASLTQRCGPMPIDTRFREAFRGGRCEALTLAPVQAVEFDRHSAYAAAFADAPEEDDLMHVLVKVKRTCKLPPFFHAPAGKLLFPCGNVQTWAYRSHVERYYQPHNDGSWRIQRTNLAERIDLRWLVSAAPFLRKMYDARSEEGADLATNLACKAVLVGCYGKIGLSGEVDTCIIADRPPRTGDYYQIGPGEFLVFRTIQQRQVKANYPMAAFVADNARAVLWSQAVQTDPAYMDTDALYCTTLPGATSRREPQPQGPGLGEWEYRGADRLQVIGAKDYTFGSKVKRKGGEHVRSYTLRGWARTGTIVETHRDRKSTYDKRHVLPDGSTVAREV